jgi:adenylosuccinate lyase
MLERYSRPEMSAIWTEENKYQAWLEVEILADEAWAELGEIPKKMSQRFVKRQHLMWIGFLKLNKKHVMMWWHSHVLYLKV